MFLLDIFLSQLTHSLFQPHNPFEEKDDDRKKEDEEREDGDSLTRLMQKGSLPYLQTGGTRGGRICGGGGCGKSGGNE